MAKNDAKKGEIYHKILKQEEAQKRQAFDAMKGELQSARNKNYYKKRNVYENIVAAKRETSREYYRDIEPRYDQILEVTEGTDAGGKRSSATWWEPNTEPIGSVEDKDGQPPVSPQTLCRHALRMTRELLDLQNKFLIGVIQQFYRIKEKNEIKWDAKFKQILMDCQSILDYDRNDVQMRIVGREDPPDLTTMPLKPDSVSDLIKYFNSAIKIIVEDKELRGVDGEIRTIRRLFDNAEAELLRFNHRIRKFMKRIADKLSSTVTNAHSTTPTFSL